jgi:hypothetical protein
MANQNVFTQEDNNLLEEGIELRRKLIRGLMPKNKIPKVPEDQKTILSAISGIDNVVLNRAKIRVQQHTNEERDEIINYVGELLLNSKRNLNALPNRTGAVSLSSNHRCEDIKPGETDIGIQILDLENFEH